MWLVADASFEDVFVEAERPAEQRSQANMPSPLIFQEAVHQMESGIGSCHEGEL